LIIICSTTGQGELPRNAKRFFKFLLRKKLPGDLLSHLEITSFGLGDSSYPKFNYAIRKLHARLMQLGCQELCLRCEADEQAPEGVDKFYSEWEFALTSTLQTKCNVVELDAEYVLAPETPVKVVDSEPDIDTLGDASIATSRPELRVGTLVQNKRVTAPDHFQDVRHITITAENLKYVPGDTIALYPSNDDESVEQLIQLQPHWIPFVDKPLEILGRLPHIEGGFIDKNRLTLRSLLKYHVDLSAVPRHSFFFSLWHFVDSSSEDGAREKEKLRDFSKFEDSEDLYNYANRPRRLILETIEEFHKNLEIPIAYIMDIFPLIHPRLFLIASRPSSTLVEIVVGLVEYKTIIRRIRRGLCSKWLKEMAPNTNLVFSIHDSNISFSNNPIIMVAPGTGIAPMKSLIEEKVIAGSPPLYLFYGCRNHEKDYLFLDVWEGLQQQKKLHFYPCFSRDGSNIKYVQHRLYQQKKLVGELLLKERATIFICGSSGSMPTQVRITLTEILQEIGQLSNDEAAKYLLEMESNGRYIQETW
jgi:sulfite reductase alpha subunit-like flavoprotein